MTIAAATHYATCHWTTPTFARCDTALIRTLALAATNSACHSLLLDEIHDLAFRPVAFATPQLSTILNRAIMRANEGGPP